MDICVIYIYLFTFMNSKNSKTSDPYMLVVNL